MITLFLGVGIICIIVFVNNLVSVLNKVIEKKDTSKNTFICCVTLIYLWISTIMLCSS